MTSTGSPSRPRRGITLIELLVVMSGIAIILGLCAVTIQVLFRLDADGQARLSASASFARLAGQFRSDVHACDAAVLVPPSGPAAKKNPDGAAEPRSAASLRLTRGPKTVITYEAREGRVARVETISGKVQAHESYRIGKGNLVTFERRDDGALRFLVMILAREARKNALEPARPLEVLALPGKDRRATAASTTPKGGGGPR